MYDLLKLLGVGLGALESEVKAQFKAMPRIYHPDKHKTEQRNI